MQIYNKLHWPVDTPRTRAKQLSKTKLSYLQSIAELASEINHSTLTTPILLVDVQTDNAGNPTSKPLDSGVVLYAKKQDGTIVVFCCDRYYKVADNIRQLARYIHHGRKLAELPVHTVNGLKYLQDRQRALANMPTGKTALNP